jgi:hypothetical protein
MPFTIPHLKQFPIYVMPTFIVFDSTCVIHDHLKSLSHSMSQHSYLTV